MRHIFILIATSFVLFVTGCATPLNQGNLITNANINQVTLAEEAAKQIAALWSPAKTQLELKQATPDPFGAALVAALRERGYAVLEFSSTPAKSPTDATATTMLPLGYLLDQAGTPTLYRVTLTVGGQSITRPYVDQDGTLYPAGYWVRKE